MLTPIEYVYTLFMSSIVVGFESSSPLAEGEEEVQKSYDFVHVAEALAVAHAPPALHIAENVFARCAKKKLRKVLDEHAVGTRMSTYTEYNEPPLWKVGCSVVIRKGKALAKEEAQVWMEDVAVKLEELVVAVANMVDTMSGPKVIVLMEALQCKITEVGPNVFKFEIKQLWGVQ